MNELVSDYEHLGRCLRDSGISCSPSWLHGLIFGLVAAHDDRWETVLAGLTQCDRSLTRAMDLTHSLCHSLWESLDGPGLDFGILLPPETHALEERAAELSAWARGYLEGLGAAGVTGDALPTEAGRHAIDELRTIVDNQGTGIATDEEALEEAVEHTWVTAVLLRELLVVVRERR